MKLSAPAYRLKRNAKLLSRETNIPLNQALDRIARSEGYESWSLLAAKLARETPAKTLFNHLRPGDLLLLGARPGHGKTLLSLELAIEAMRSGSKSMFFTLEYGQRDMEDCFRAIGADWKQWSEHFGFDDSNAISAPYVMAALKDAPKKTLVVIDYLQLLDQQRQKPALEAQIKALKTFARARGLFVVLNSQIDRAYDPSCKPVPDAADVRLPNPLDLALFNKTCFLHNGEIRFQAAH